MARESMTKKIIVQCHGSKKIVFLWFNFMFEQINHIRTAVHGHAQLFLKCRLPNCINFDIFDWCFCEVETRACETLRSCAKRWGGLAVTTLPMASPSFNQALATRVVQPSHPPRKVDEPKFESLGILYVNWTRFWTETAFHACLGSLLF